MGVDGHYIMVCKAIRRTGREAKPRLFNPMSKIPLKNKS